MMNYKSYDFRDMDTKIEGYQSNRPWDHQLATDYNPRLADKLHTKEEHLKKAYDARPRFIINAVALKDKKEKGPPQ